MPDKKSDQSDQTQVVVESFGPIAARIDTEKGVVHDALIFGPKKRVGPYYQGRSGLYTEEFFQSLAEAVEGAWSWDGHPDLNQKIPSSRKVKDAIGKWAEVKVVKEAGLPRVRGHYKIRPKVKDEYTELISEGADRFAFSIYGPVKRRWDADVRQDVAYAVDGDARLKFTVDLVEAGGTNDSIFESATTDDQNKEEPDMTKEEVQAMLDERETKIRAEVMESVKPEIDKVQGLVAENAALKRKQLIADAITEHKLDREHVTDAFLKSLQTCEESAIADLVADRKGLVAKRDVISDAGGSTDTKGKETEMTSEQAVEVCSARGLHTVVAEMAGTGFGNDAEKDRAFSKKWVDLIGRRIANRRDQSPETRELRKTVIEQYGNVGLRQLFSQCYGKMPLSMADMSVLPTYTDDRPISVAEAAIASTGFSSLNNTVLASVMIDAQNDATGLVADQLAQPYPTNKETENVPGFDEPSDMEEVAEAAEKPDATLANKYVTLQKIEKRAKKVVLTREAVFYDRTAQILDRANRISINAALDREKYLIYGLIDDPNNYAYYPSGVRAPLWDHTNTEESNGLSDYSDIEKAVIRLSRQVDSLSRRLRDNVGTPFEMLIPFELSVLASKILGAELFETNPGGTANIRFRNNYSSTRVYVSQTLDAINPTTWYIAGAGGFRKQYLRKITFPLEIVPVPAAEVDTVIKDQVGGVAVMYAERIFARENVRVVRNVSVALSS